mmetsp:Transcript_19990/g.31904  ORF Transcript_19990/g.31904 Transcript_19990/m.31904 type:complete len:252 (+) Transcript_19990:84-839(+)
METALSVAPWALFFQASYWGSRMISPLVFSTSWASLSEAKSEKGYWAATFTGIVHALLVTATSVAAIWQDPTFLSSSDAFQVTPLSHLSCCIFLGYIISDLALSSFFMSTWPGWQANLVHHLLVLVSWYQVTVGGYMHGPCLAAMACEITTPFVSARWLLDKTGMKESKIYFWNGMAMMVLWFFFRVCWYSGQTFRIYQLREGLLTLPTLNICVFLISFFAGAALQLYWFSKLLKGAIKVLTTPKGPSKKT